jgi:hypothetical protein
MPRAQTAVPAFVSASHLGGCVVVVFFWSHVHGTQAHFPTRLMADERRLDVITCAGVTYLQTVFGGQRPWRQTFSVGLVNVSHHLYWSVVVVVVVESLTHTHEGDEAAASDDAACRYTQWEPCWHIPATQEFAEGSVIRSHLGRVVVVEPQKSEFLAQAPVGHLYGAFDGQPVVLVVDVHAVWLVAQAPVGQRYGLSWGHPWFVVVVSRDRPTGFRWTTVSFNVVVVDVVARVSLDSPLVNPLTADTEATAETRNNTTNIARTVFESLAIGKITNIDWMWPYLYYRFLVFLYFFPGYCAPGEFECG